MSFLERLIARADGSAPLLARRTRSPFEPEGDQRAAPILDVLVEPAPGVLQPSDEQARALPRDARARAAEHAERPGALTSGPPSRAHADPSECDAAVPRSSSKLGPLSEPPSRALPSQATSIARVLAGARGKGKEEAAGALPSARRAHPHALPLERSSAVHEIAGAPPERASVVQPAGERVLLKPVRVIEAVPAKGLLRPEQGMRARPLPRPAQRGKAPAIAAPVIAEQTEQAPSIEISIGRVEIRAVPGAAERPAREARPAGPKLSLEDYLRQRNGGPR